MTQEILKLQPPQFGKISTLIGVAHHLEAWTNNQKSNEFKQFLAGYRTFLERKLNFKKMGITFCGSKRSACELALLEAYKNRKNKKAKKVLVFSHTFSSIKFETVRSAPLTKIECRDSIFALVVDPSLGIKSGFFKLYKNLKIPIVFDQTEVAFSYERDFDPSFITLSPHPSLGILISHSKNFYKIVEKVSVATILCGYYQSMALDQNLGEKNQDIDSIIKATELLLEIKNRKVKNSSLQEKQYLKHLQKIFLKDVAHEFTLENLTEINFKKYLAEIKNLEKSSYEKARQTPISEFEITIKSSSSISFVLFYKQELVGMIFASAIKNYPHEKGLKQDPYFKDAKSLYVVDCTVSDKLKGKNLGKFLKYALTMVAILRGYKRIEGRIRDHLAKSMLAINLSLGSYCYRYHKNFYSDNEKYKDVLFYTTLISWNNKKRFSHSQLKKGIKNLIRI